jgi:hypothetical protein
MKITRLRIYNRNNNSRPYRFTWLIMFFTFRSFPPPHMNINTPIPKDFIEWNRVRARDDSLWLPIKYYPKSDLKTRWTKVGNSLQPIAAPEALPISCTSRITSADAASTAILVSSSGAGWRREEGNFCHRRFKCCSSCFGISNTSINRFELASDLPVRNICRPSYA